MDIAEQIVRDISKNTNINNYIIIGLGRSPSVVMAYFQECLGLSAFNIPLSSFRGKDYFLREKLERKLFDHIEL